MSACVRQDHGLSVTRCFRSGSMRSQSNRLSCTPAAAAPSAAKTHRSRRPRRRRRRPSDGGDGRKAKGCFAGRCSAKDFRDAPAGNSTIQNSIDFGDARSEEFGRLFDLQRKGCWHAIGESVSISRRIAAVEGMATCSPYIRLSLPPSVKQHLPRILCNIESTYCG